MNGVKHPSIFLLARRQINQRGDLSKESVIIFLQAYPSETLVTLIQGSEGNAQGSGREGLKSTVFPTPPYNMCVDLHSSSLEAREPC